MLSLSNGYKVRNEFFGGLLFNFENGKIMNINQVAYSIFHALSTNIDPIEYLISQFPSAPKEVIKNDVQAFIKEMTVRGILSENGNGIVIRNDVFSDHSLAAPRSVFWESSDVCNIGTCVHCYSYEKCDFDLQQPRIDKLSKIETRLLSQLEQTGVFSVDIGGGEPFTNPSLMAFVNKANQRLIRCNIATNLYFEQEFILQRIQMIDWKFNVLQVSLDGLESYHEAIRRKKGCFSKTVNNIKTLISQGIPVHVNYTVTKINYENIADFIEFAFHLQVSSVRFVRVIASGNALKNNLTISNTQYHKMCIMLKEKQEDYPSLRIKVDDSFMFIDEDVLPSSPRISWLKRPYLGCGAGRTLCNVAYNGDVFPCAYIYAEEYKCGNIFENDLIQIWRSSTVMNLFRNLDELDSPCHECDMKHICLGGCRAHAIGLGQTIHSFDSGCWKDQYERH